MMASAVLVVGLPTYGYGLVRYLKTSCLSLSLSLCFALSISCTFCSSWRFMGPKNPRTHLNATSVWHMQSQISIIVDSLIRIWRLKRVLTTADTRFFFVVVGVVLFFFFLSWPRKGQGTQCVSVRIFLSRRPTNRSLPPLTPQLVPDLSHILFSQLGYLPSPVRELIPHGTSLADRKTSFTVTATMPDVCVMYLSYPFFSCLDITSRWCSGLGAAF